MPLKDVDASLQCVFGACGPTAPRVVPHPNERHSEHPISGPGATGFVSMAHAGCGRFPYFHHGLNLFTLSVSRITSHYPRLFLEPGDVVANAKGIDIMRRLPVMRVTVLCSRNAAQDSKWARQRRKHFWSNTKRHARPLCWHAPLCADCSGIRCMLL